MDFRRGFNDPRKRYDPNDPYMSSLVNLTPYMSFGLYRPLENRIREFISRTRSKNNDDKGLGSGY